MTKITFKEQVFDPIAEKYMVDLHFYLDESRDVITTKFIGSLNTICNEISTITLPNAKYIVFSLLRTHLVATGEFLYSARIFDEELTNSKELSSDCLYEASWLTESFKKFSEDIEGHVSKSMIKHDPVYIKELMAQVVNDFNIYFARAATDFLMEYNNDALNGFSVLAGDYMFSPNCLVHAKFEKIKTFVTGRLYSGNNYETEN